MLDLGAPALVSVSGERLIVPPTVYEVLRKVVELMAEGKAVTLLPDNQVVTTQRAADLLGMSRPFFVKLLEPAQWPTIELGISVASISETSLNSLTSATKSVRLLSTVSPGKHLKLGCMIAT